jgi:uncharacterized membrane protein YfcA
MAARTLQPLTVSDVRIHWVRVGIIFLVAVVAITAVVNPVVVLAALLTGILNTAAGGGAIVTFLALTAVGVPALTAHATGQLVTPASFLGAFRLVKGYWPGWRLLRIGCFGTLLGVGMLKLTPAGTFQAAAPFFLVPAAILVVVQEPVKRRIQRSGRTFGTRITLIATFLCGVYAGLIGVGVGTLTLVVLGLTPAFAGASLPQLLRSRNVLLLGMAILVACAFAATGLVDWKLAALLAPAGALGGWLGTKLVNRLPVPVLQGLIAATAIGGATWMALR